MAYSLVEEAMDHAARLGLTAAERWAFVVLVRDANHLTRQTYHHATHPELLHRAGVDRDAWRHLRTALVRKGALQVAIPGRRSRGAFYSIPDLATIRPSMQAHPADAERQMADPYGPESRMDGGPHGSGIERSMADLMGPVSRPMADPDSPPSEIAPIAGFSSPPPPVVRVLPTARQGDGGRTEGEEEIDASFIQAYKLLAGLDHRIAVAKGRSRVIPVATEVSKLLRAGWAPGRLQRRLNSALSDGYVVRDPVGFLLAKLETIPVDPSHDADSGRPDDRSLGDLKIAPRGQRQGAVDIAAAGGWREAVRERQEGS